MFFFFFKRVRNVDISHVKWSWINIVWLRLLRAYLYSTAFYWDLNTDMYTTISITTSWEVTYNLRLYFVVNESLIIIWIRFHSDLQVHAETVDCKSSNTQWDAVEMLSAGCLKSLVQILCEKLGKQTPGASDNGCLAAKLSDKGRI